MFLEKTNHQEPIRPWAEFNKAVVNPEVVVTLKTLLSDVVTFYFRAHGYHWNVKGQDFAQYHELFSAIYEDAYGSVDPIAENILKLGADAPFKLTEFVQMRTIIDENNVPNSPAEMAMDLMRANQQVLSSLNMAFGQANSANQQGVANFLAERIDMHQKWDWQLRSSVSNQI